MSEMKKDTKKRIDWLDALKGIGIAFIVMGHIVGAWCHLGTGISSQVAMLSYKYFYAFHVPLFFVIAGMTFRARPWNDFFKGIGKRLIVPYLLFGVASILIYWCLYDVIVPLVLSSDSVGHYASKTGQLSLGTQILHLLVGGYSAESFTANSVLWFIPALVSVMLVGQALFSVLTWKYRWSVLIFLCIALFWVKLPWLPWGANLIPRYLPYFILGNLIGTRVVVSEKRTIALIGAIGLIVVFGATAVWNPWQYFPKCMWQKFFNFMVATGNIFGWILLAQSFNLSKMVRYWGTQSMGIMLMHKFPVLFFQNFIPMSRALFAGALISGICGCFLVFVIAMAMTCGACWVIGRFAPWMLGERTHK